MEYSFERVVDLLWDPLRTTSAVATLIEAEWQSSLPGLSLEQSIDEAISRHAILGYGTETTREREKQNFGIELSGCIEPVNSDNGGDTSDLEGPDSAAGEMAQ